MWMKAVQYIPLAGWMFSHFPGESQKDVGPEALVLTVSTFSLNGQGCTLLSCMQAMGDGEMQWQRKRN
jgi:hypothetical protein